MVCGAFLRVLLSWGRIGIGFPPLSAVGKGGSKLPDPGVGESRAAFLNRLESKGLSQLACAESSMKVKASTYSTKGNTP